jgi:magnesium-transporting ATPase (P-type)
LIYALSFPVPENFNTVLETYTQEGYRVIAIGYKQLDMNYTKVIRTLIFYMWMKLLMSVEDAAIHSVFIVIDRSNASYEKK